MKRLLFFLCFCFFGNYVLCQSKNDFPKMTKSDGSLLDISSLMGKKTVIVFMQTNLCDSLWYNEYEAFTNRYYGIINLIVIPMVNDDSSQIKQVQEYFMHEERSSTWSRMKTISLKYGNVDKEQVPEYFMNRKMNRHFQIEIIRPGDKFFLDETGELYAVVGSMVSLNSSNILKILERKVSQK